jgi:hypothetical protein
MGHRMRAGFSAIAGGPLTARALRARPPHPQPGPQGAPTSRRAGKEPVFEYNSDSDAAPDRASDSSPLSEFFSNPDYEFDFGSDREEPESENDSTELVRASFGAGYQIHASREIRLLARPQAR